MHHMNLAIPIIGKVLTFSAHPLGERARALATPGQSYDMPFLSIHKLYLFGGGAPDAPAVQASPTIECSPIPSLSESCHD